MGGGRNLLTTQSIGKKENFNLKMKLIKSQGVTKVITIHPLRIMNVSPSFIEI